MGDSILLGRHNDPEEEVSKLKSATSKTSRSSIALIAATMEANAYWREQLFQYVKQVPAMLEWSPKIAMYEASLHLMPGDMTTAQLEEYAVIVKDLYVIQEVLQVERIQGFLDHVLDVGRGLASAVLGTLAPGDEARQKLQQVSSSWEQLVILFPEQPALTQVAAGLSERMSAFEEETQAFQLQTVCRQLRTAWLLEEPKKDEVRHLLATLNETALAMKAPVNMPAQSCVDAVLDGWEVLIAMLGAFWFKDEPELAVGERNKVSYLLESLLGLLNIDDEAVVELGTLMQCASDCHQRFVEIRQHKKMTVNEILDDEGHLEKIKAVLRTRMAVQQKSASFDKVPRSELVTTAWGKFQTVFADEGKFVAALSETLEKRNYEEVKRKYDELAQVARGKADGDAWDKELGPSVSWKAMVQAFGEQKLFTVAPQTLGECYHQFGRGEPSSPPALSPLLA